MAGTDKSAEMITGGPAIILVEPQLGQNIGTAARAMANFGLSDLRIINPRDGWPDPQAIGPSAKAKHIIDAVQVFDTLAGAIADLNFVVATTARPRDMFMTVRGPEEAANDMRAREARGEQCGILFGRERWGLENEEIAQADEIVTFPVNPAFASLNIAQAVLLMSYEMMRASTDTSKPMFDAPEAEPATKTDMQGLFDHLEGALDDANFFRPIEKRGHMVTTLRTILQKGRYTLREVQVLRGIIAALQGRKTRMTPRRLAKEQSQSTSDEG